MYKNSAYNLLWYVKPLTPNVTILKSYKIKWKIVYWLNLYFHSSNKYRSSFICFARSWENHYVNNKSCTLSKITFLRPNYSSFRIKTSSTCTHNVNNGEMLLRPISNRHVQEIRLRVTFFRGFLWSWWCVLHTHKLAVWYIT